MRERLSAALKEAIKNQDKTRMSTLRLIHAAVKDRDIAAAGGDNDAGVSDEEILDILAKMIRQRDESATTYADAGRDDLATRERDEITIITEFLPPQLGEEDIAAAVDAAIAEIGAATLKDIGKVMGVLKRDFAGQMDFGKAGALVKQRLG